MLIKAAVDGGHGDGGPCQWPLLLTEAAVGWRDNDAMASGAIASLTNGGGGNGNRCFQLCSDS